MANTRIRLTVANTGDANAGTDWALAFPSQDNASRRISVNVALGGRHLTAGDVPNPTWLIKATSSNEDAAPLLIFLDASFTQVAGRITASGSSINFAVIPNVSQLWIASQGADVYQVEVLALSQTEP